MPSLKMKPSTKKKYTHPMLWLHYVLLCLGLNLFHIKPNLQFFYPMFSMFSIDIYGQIRILWWNVAWETIYAYILLFFVVVILDILIHVTLGKTTGWED